MKPSLTPLFQTRKDRNRNGGGIAIYIKNNISHFERVDLTLDSGNLELICPRADGAKRRARVLIPPGYLHPGKRKH